MSRALRSKGVLVVFLAMSLLACAGTPPSNLGVREMRLAPCPGSPNCVSSDAQDSDHRVDALRIEGSTRAAWEAAVEEVSRLSRSTLVTREPDYLHAECASALFGFVDDLELHLREEQGLIAVRSASRLGYSDLGVNRRRVEHIRKRLAERGVVRD